jgi:hypothetical protein
VEVRSHETDCSSYMDMDNYKHVLKIYLFASYKHLFASYKQIIIVAQERQLVTKTGITVKAPCPFVNSIKSNQLKKKCIIP